MVESPTKAKTIGRILGKGYVVEASMGHLRDLPKSKLGVDTENNFEPDYIIPTASRKVVSRLKKLNAEAGKLILATDEDREGEAIGWHVAEALGVDGSLVPRIVFHEITDEAVKEAIEHPRKLDMNLIHSQQARRVLDRLVGYKLSPLLWKKIFRGLSAGRVQSVAVRLIVERERERQAFKPEEYWKIKVDYSATGKSFIAELAKIGEAKADITNQVMADAVVADINNNPSVVSAIEHGERIKSPNAPFTTSTLQQQAGTVLGYSVKKTMMLAQQLYEGVELDGDGQVGLITYMRTDSNFMAAKAVTEIREFLGQNFGEQYVPTEPRLYKTKAKGAQEAHEAIRPTSAFRSPKSLEAVLSRDHLRLYKLIWERALASQMKDAIISEQNVKISCGDKILTAQGVGVKFPGYIAVLEKNPVSEVTLPKLSENEALKVNQVIPEQKFTEPPDRFTEPSLVKTLEKLGIGRPSTYAPTITTIISRGYIKKEKRTLVPQEVGFLVNDFLVEHFPDIVDSGFTAEMEEDLDRIAEGEKKWNTVIAEFYKPFAKQLAEKEATVEKKDLAQQTDQECDKCGGPMVIRMGRFGKFLACSNFPKCKNTKSLEPEGGSELPKMACPKCAEGQIVSRRTKRGKIFYGCSNYPKCDFASWDEPVPEKCPTCNGLMVKKPLAASRARGQAKTKLPTCTQCGFEDKSIDPSTSLPEQGEG